jgi:hypothetical protein
MCQIWQPKYNFKNAASVYYQIKHPTNTGTHKATHYYTHIILSLSPLLHLHTHHMFLAVQGTDHFNIIRQTHSKLHSLGCVLSSQAHGPGQPTLHGTFVTFSINSAL